MPSEKIVNVTTIHYTFIILKVFEPGNDKNTSRLATKLIFSTIDCMATETGLKFH